MTAANVLGAAILAACFAIVIWYDADGWTGALTKMATAVAFLAVLYIGVRLVLS